MTNPDQAVSFGERLNLWILACLIVASFLMIALGVDYEICGKIAAATVGWFVGVCLYYSMTKPIFKRLFPKVFGSESLGPKMTICSKHREPVDGCKLCQVTARDVLPDYDAKLAEAKLAGSHKCEHCGFIYYLTSDVCPKCSRQFKINRNT